MTIRAAQCNIRSRRTDMSNLEMLTLLSSLDPGIIKDRTSQGNSRTLDLPIFSLVGLPRDISSYLYFSFPAILYTSRSVYILTHTSISINNTTTRLCKNHLFSVEQTTADYIPILWKEMTLRYYLFNKMKVSNLLETLHRHSPGCLYSEVLTTSFLFLHHSPSSKTQVQPENTSELKFQHPKQSPQSRTQISESSFIVQYQSY